MSYFRVNDKCNGCLACVQNCPACALSHEDRAEKRTLRHNMTLCARCGQCWRVCPQEAIEFQHLLESAWDDVVTLDLVRCSICGEVLYTTSFGRTVREHLNQEVNPLCPRHQEAHNRLAKAHFHPGGKQLVEVKK